MTTLEEEFRELLNACKLDHNDENAVTDLKRVFMGGVVIAQEICLNNDAKNNRVTEMHKELNDYFDQIEAGLA